MNTKLKNYLIQAAMAISAILAYIIIPNLVLNYCNLVKIDYYSLSTNLKVLLIIIFEIIAFTTIVFIYRDILIRSFKDFRINFKKYADEYFKYWILILVVMFLSNSLITYFTGSKLPKNEVAVRNIFEVAPIYMFLTTVFYAPVIEELIFRLSIKKIIPKKILFIIASGLVFGGLHVLTNYSGPTDLLYLIPYCTPGFVFAYLLSKTDNIFVPMSIHFLHNGVLMIMQLLLSFLA